MTQHELMTADEVAELFRVDARTVNERYAYRKEFPKHIKIGQRKLWKRDDIYAYIDQLQKAA